MPDTVAPVSDAPISTLPGAGVLLAVRRLLIWALSAALAYSVLGGSSMGYCPGGITGDGGFIDADGRRTELAPQCVSVTLEPTGFMFVLIAIIVLSAISRVLRRSTDQTDAIRRLDMAAAAIVVVVIAWTIITKVSFAQIPIMEWDGVEPFHLPYTFGTIDVRVEPMQG